MTIEHFVAQSADSTKVNDYDNCFWCCWYCNRARSKKPTNDDKGSYLLNPVDNVWADHFDVIDNELVPKTKDGKYTRDCYDLNDELKTMLRRNRRARIERLRNFIRKLPVNIKEYTERAQQLSASDEPERRADAELLFQAVLELGEKLKMARSALERYRGVPSLCPQACGCEGELKLPPQLAEQLIEV